MFYNEIENIKGGFHMSFEKLITVEEFIDILNHYSHDLWLTIDCAGIAQLEGLIDSSTCTYEKERNLLSFKMGQCLQSIILQKASSMYLMRIMYCGYEVIEVMIGYDDYDSTLHFMFAEKDFGQAFPYIENTYL